MSMASESARLAHHIDNQIRELNAGMELCPVTHHYQECVRCPMNWCEGMITNTSVKCKHCGEPITASHAEEDCKLDALNL